MRRETIAEALAVAAILVALCAAVMIPLAVEAGRRRARAAEVPTLTLTGVMNQGVWTDEPVPAAGAWRRDFRRARPVLRVGETVRLRLASADVAHSFAAPELGIDPVEVYPGKIVEVLVTPQRAGEVAYYCTTVCGEPHFAMRGSIAVLPREGGEPPPPPEPRVPGYWLAAEPRESAGRLARGAWLFRQQGCVACHGEDGRGGVVNPNSMNALVPTVADLARRTFLFSAEDVAAFEAVLAAPKPLEAVRDAPDVPLFPQVKTQYLAIRKLVREGRRSVLLDPDGPRPPLDMPAWGARLSDADIDAILAYLLTLGGGEGAAADSRLSLRGQGDLP